MHFKLNNIILIQNNTVVVIKIFKNWMYYLKSASKQQTLANQNDLISLIAAPTIATPTGPARQPENSDIRSKEINEYLKWHVRMGHAGPDRLLKTIQAVDDISKNIEINKNKCVICIFNKMMKMMNKLSFLWIIKSLKFQLLKKIQNNRH